MSDNFDIPSIVKKIKCLTGYKKKPDLTFYYSLAVNEKNDGANGTAIIEELSSGKSSLNQTIYASIFDDYTLLSNIGRYTANMIIYGKNDPDNNGLCKKWVNY